MAVDREFRVRFTGDANQLNEASKAATGGLEKVEGATEDAAKAGEKATFSHRELHRAMHQIAEKSPEVAIGLKAIASGPAAGLTVLLVLLKQTAEGVANLQKSLTTSEWEGFGAVIESAKKALEGAKLEAAAFAREMDNAAKSAQTAAEKAGALAKIHTAESSAMDKVREAQKQFELAEAEKTKDPEEKEKRKAQIELRYAADKKLREDADAKFKITEEHRLIANEELFQEHNAKKLEEARQHRKGLGSEEGVGKKIEIEQARLAKTDAEMEEKQKRFDELQAKPWLRRSTPEQTEMNYLGQQLEQLGGVKSGQERLIRGLEAKRPGQIDAMHAADEEVKRLESEQSASVGRSHKLRQELPTDERIEGINARARNQVFGIDAASQVAQGNVSLPFAGALAERAGAVRPNPAFAKLPQDMAQLLSDMAQFIQAVPELQKAIAQMRLQIATRSLNHGF